MKRQIVNIVNFIRAVEPRVEKDLVTPVREQIRLMTELGLRGTFLLQYDALIQPEYTELLKALDPAQFEIGIWLETVQPLVEAAGGRWTGRYPWDWHTDCGFPVGYDKPMRERMIDEFFLKFKEIFGYYPKVFGSWFFDSHTIRYMTDHYEIDALCNCKEQYGTDGYTLWGSYYGQGYYPSRTNVFMPAQTQAEQIKTPLFRMLGSDPVLQYDFGVEVDASEARWQGVVTLEPVYLNYGGGGDPKWVDWYIGENFNGECLSFGYTQAGQENSFGWEGMKDGLTMQFKKFARMQAEGKIVVEPLGDTGRWYRSVYEKTPAAAIAAHGAFDDPEKSSVWYDSAAYRINLYTDHGNFRIRDLHIFDEKLPDPFEDTVCTTPTAVYETLPVIDGNRHSGNGVLARGYFSDADGKPLTCGELLFEDKGNGVAEVRCGGLIFTLEEAAVTIRGEADFVLAYRHGDTGAHMPEVVSCTEKQLTLRYLGREYGVRLTAGRLENALTVRAEDGVIRAEIFAD